MKRNFTILFALVLALSLVMMPAMAFNGPPLPEELWTYPTEHDVTDIAVGDLNGDGKEDVVAIDALPFNFTLHVILGDSEGVGDLYWSKPLDGLAVAVGDIDGDSLNEVVAADYGGLHVYENDGTELPWSPYTTLDAVTDIEIGDIDGNGVDDIVACDPLTSGIVYVIDGVSGNDLTGWPTGEIVGERFWDIAIGQLDGLGGMDVAVIGQGLPGTLYVYDSTGTWLFPPQPIEGRSVEIGDVDGDGDNEVVAGTFGGWVYVYDGAVGTPLYSFQTNNPVEDVELGDLDRNQLNGVEIACITGGLGDVTLYAIDIDNVAQQLMWWYDVSWQSAYWGEAIAIGDVDRDYENEVVVGALNTVYAFYGLDGDGDGLGDLVWSPYVVSNLINDVEVGDLDGDGDDDVVVGTNAPHTIHALTNPEITPPVEVGGEVYPIDKLAILAPWLVLAAALIVGAVVVVRRRRSQS